jgi:hypothetical protein
MLIDSPLHTANSCAIDSGLHRSTSNVEQIPRTPDTIHQELFISLQQAMLGVNTEDYSVGNWLWNRTYGGLDYEWGSSAAMCNDGGFAIVGSTSSFGAGDNDVWLVRTDSTGHILWNQTYGGTGGDVGRGLVRCSDGGFAIIAETGSFGAGQMDFWLVRTDSDGNHLWNRTYGGGNRDHGFSIVESSDGGFVLMGMTISFGGPDKDLWLVRTNSAGDHLWNYTYGGGQIDEGLSMVQCRDGGLAIVGYSDELGMRDVWLVRTDNDGIYLWERRFDVGLVQRGEAIAECSDGGFIITGNLVSAGRSDMWLIRTNSTGHHQWDRIYSGIGNDYGFAVTERDDGNFAVAGFTNSSGAGNQDGWLVLANSTGHHIWNQTYGGADNDFVMSMVETPLGEFALAGYTFSFGMGSADTWLLMIPQVVWREPVTSQSSEFGLGFHYDLNATSSAGIDRWWLNDTIHFAVDQEGVITNKVDLGPVGTVYGLLVSVNDTFGNTLNGAFSVTVEPDASPPSWVEVPTDQFVELGEDFLYDINATDPSGISQWSVDDTVRFTIDWAGRIRSIEPLSLGPYGLTVYVSDVYDRMLSAQFTVWVRDTLPPSWTTLPTDQVLQPGEGLSYQLVAWDLSGISSWTLNDTLRFEVSTTGLLTNITTLPSGVYGLTVTASDPFGNVITASFAITVQAEYEPPGPFLSEPLVLSSIIAGSFVLGVVFYVFLGPILKRRKKPD